MWRFLEQDFTIFCYSVVMVVPPELYIDATKQFSSDFILRQEAVITAPVTTFILAPNNCAFAILGSTLQLAKFNLPPANEKVQQ